MLRAAARRGPAWLPQMCRCPAGPLTPKNLGDLQQPSAHSHVSLWLGLACWGLDLATLREAPAGFWPSDRLASVVRAAVRERMAGRMSTEVRAGAERPRPITVVLVDEDWMVRSTLVETLSAAGVEVVGEAINGEEAIGLVRDVLPDVVLIAIKLPGISGVEAIKRLAVLTPASRLLVLTHAEQNRVVEAIVAGASGYILKSAPPEAIIDRRQGNRRRRDRALPPKSPARSSSASASSTSPVTSSGHSAATAIRAALTQRELEIFTRLASGHTDKQIGQELSLSTNTIANHVKNILAKLQLENRTQAAVQSVRAGIS